MTNNDSKSILAIYLDKLHQIIPSAGLHNFVFRGLENKGWGLESTAYLRYGNPPTRPEFVQDNCELINKAKNANYHIKENNELEEIELLAELRHHGAATALIDFTRDFHIALWFASKSYKKNGTETDGKVVIVNIGDSNVFLQLTSNDRKKSLDDIFNFKTRRDQDNPEASRFGVDGSTSEISSQKKAKLWYWQPRFAINHRLSAQKGVFIFGEAKIDLADVEYWEVIISQEHKKAIIRELSTCFGIDEDSLFNDLPGFAMVNDKDHKLQPKTAGDYFQKAVQHHQRGELDQAAQSIDDAIKLNFKNDMFHFFRGLLNYDMKRYEDALRDIANAIELDPDKSVHHLLRGQVNHDLERYEDVLRDVNKAIELEPDKPVYHFFRGQVNHDLEKLEDALRDFTKVIELGPEEAVNYSFRGLLNCDLENYEDALRDVNKAIELEPDEAVYYCSRGQINRGLKRYEDALRDVNKAIEMEPDEAVHHFSRGQVNYNIKRNEDALRDIDKAIALSPYNDEHYYFRGLINHDLKRHEDGLMDFDMAIKLNPDISEHYYRRGLVNQDLSKHEDAQRDFDKAKRLEASSPEPLPQDI